MAVQDFSEKYAAMTDAALQQLLQDDLNALPEALLEPDEALYIAGLLARRQGVPRADVAAAKAKFDQEYLPQVQVERRRRGSRGKAWGCRRLVGALSMVVFCLMYVGTVTANALGYNPDLDIYTLSVGLAQGAYGEDRPVTAELAEILAQDESAVLIPKWLPEGYKLDKNTLYAFSANVQYYRLTDGRLERLFIHYDTYNRDRMSHIRTLYESNFGHIVLYRLNDIDFYIMGTAERRTITWDYERVGATITGRLSLEEAQKIINSIFD